MTGQAVKGIDHAVVVVADIEAARAAYARLGFEVQPRGFHTRLGTANHLMIFGDTYLELIGIVEPSPFNAERRAWLEKGGGLANVALRTDGADIAHAAWTACGLQPDPVLDFGRAVEIGGRTEQATFRTVRLGTNRARLGLLRLRAPHAAIRLSPGMGPACQRHHGAGGRRGYRRRSRHR